MKPIKQKTYRLQWWWGVVPSALLVLQNTDDDHDSSTIENATVTFEDAVGIALQHVPGKAIEVELEQEDGLTIWEVEIMSTKR